MFGARAGRAAAEYAWRSSRLRASAVLAQAADEEARLEQHFCRRAAAGSGSPTIREEMQQTMEQCAGIYRDGESLAEAADKLGELQERFRDIKIEDHSRTFNTELMPRWSCVHARRGGDDRAVRPAARGVARRPPAHRLPRARRPEFLAHSLVYRSRRPSPGRVPAGDDHALAPGERIYGRVKPAMAEPDQRCEVTPTTDPGARDGQADASRSTRSRCHKEWVVLDALNYIKDHLDGTLSFRWSCRMGICGSCGMMVNGEPKLTCATFLTDYAPGPVRVEPLRNFPVIRDLVVDIDDFMRS